MNKKLERERRLEICKTCEKFDSFFTRCKECGCFLKIKTWFMNSRCPLDKWGEQFDILEYLENIKEQIIIQNASTNKDKH